MATATSAMARGSVILPLVNGERMNQPEFHRQFTEAWNFLTIQTVRHVGRHCQKPAAPQWKATVAWLVSLYEQWGHAEQASQWRDRLGGRS